MKIARPEKQGLLAEFAGLWPVTKVVVVLGVVLTIGLATYAVGFAIGQSATPAPSRYAPEKSSAYVNRSAVDSSRDDSDDTRWSDWANSLLPNNPGIHKVGTRPIAAGRRDIYLLVDEVDTTTDASTTGTIALAYPVICESVWKKADTAFPGRVGCIYILPENPANPGAYLPVGKYEPASGYIVLNPSGGVSEVMR